MEKSDKTIGERERRHRQARLAQGWKKITVWVPTDQDANDVREFAKERRDKAERLEALKELNVKAENIERIAKAIGQYGSNAYTESAGPVLDLMTQLTEEGDLKAVSVAYCILARAKPTSAPLLASVVPAKISNFLIRHRGVNGGQFYDWSSANPDWSKAVVNALSDPARFARVVEDIAENIKRH